MTVVLVLLDSLRRRIALALALFILFAIGATGAVYLKKPSYEASAKLLLNLEGLPLSLSRAELPPTGAQMQAVEAVTNQVEILGSRDLVEQLVDALGPEAFAAPPPGNPLVRAVVGAIGAASRAVSARLAAVGLIEPVAPRDALVEALRARLTVYAVRQSQVIDVALTWPDPAMARVALGKLLDIYLARVAALSVQFAEQGVLQEQAQRASEALDAAEREIRALQSRHDVVDPAREKQLLADRIERLTLMLGDAGGAQSPGPESGGATAPELDGVGARIADLRERINTHTIDRARAMARFTGDHAAVREIDAQIAAAKEALARESALLDSALTQDRARLRRVLDIESDFARAMRGRDVAADAYRTYRQAANDRRVMQLQSQELSVRVIDSPRPPIRARGPSRLVLAIAGLIFSAGFACVIAVAVERLAEALAALRPTDGADAPPATASGAEPPTLLAARRDRGAAEK